MASTSTPAYEVIRALVEAFRADTAFSNTGGWLFPAWAPTRISGDDDRVYSVAVELPEDTAIKEALPRILIEARWTPHDYEQEQPGILHGPVTAYVHVVVPREQEEYGDHLMAAAILKVISTRLSGARMIAAELVPTTGVLKDRIPAFNEAWEWIAGFASRNVEVLG